MKKDHDYSIFLAIIAIWMTVSALAQCETLEYGRLIALGNNTFERSRAETGSLARVIAIRALDDRIGSTFRRIEANRLVTDLDSRLAPPMPRATLALVIDAARHLDLVAGGRAVVCLLQRFVCCRRRLAVGLGIVAELAVDVHGFRKQI